MPNLSTQLRASVANPFYLTVLSVDAPCEASEDGFFVVADSVAFSISSHGERAWIVVKGFELPQNNGVFNVWPERGNRLRVLARVYVETQRYAKESALANEKGESVSIRANLWP